MQQLQNAARMPFVHPHGIAAMADVHAGIGATVGSVIATDRAIIPAAVGVDIGCGMMAQTYPQSRFVGFDFHPASIDAARRRAR